MYGQPYGQPYGQQPYGQAAGFGVNVNVGGQGFGAQVYGGAPAYGTGYGAPAVTEVIQTGGYGGPAVTEVIQTGGYGGPAVTEVIQTGAYGTQGYAAPGFGAPAVTTTQSFGVGVGGYGVAPAVTTTATYAYAPAGGYIAYAQPRRVSFQNMASGKWLCAKHGECYTHHTPYHNDAAFLVKYLGYEDLVEIVTSHGHYLACNGGSVYVSHHHHEYETKWHMEWYNGQVAFRVNYHNKYLGIGAWDAFGGVRAHHEFTQCELFNEVPASV